jgi:hypothetical protein
MAKKNTKTYVLAPINEAEYNKLVDKLMSQYKFPSREHVIAVVSNRIMHASPDQELFTVEYFAACVRKNIAYQTAEAMAKNCAHKSQIQDLVAHIKTNPGDAQAVDMLQKHAQEGSPYALAALDELGIEFTQKPEAVPPVAVPEKAPENETIQ